MVIFFVAFVLNYKQTLAQPHTFLGPLIRGCNVSQKQNLIMILHVSHKKVEYLLLSGCA